MNTMRMTLLGATGSIGASAVDVMMRHPEHFSAFALVGYRNVERMREIALQLTPDYVVMTDTAAAVELKTQLPPTIRVEAGMDAAIAVASDVEVHMVLAAMVGSVGIPAALAAVRAGKRVGLANKECLVTAGHIFMDAARQSGAIVVPVDSEHAAVHQCMAGHDVGSVTRIILTASGGPFRDRDPATLRHVTPAEAIAHPNWDMGAKISVDSATMMNKALELIEARWLFDVPAERLSAIIHPQSVIHALVEYCDGSVLAQLALPDMRAPIAYAMQAEPRLATGIPWLELATCGRLDFETVDEVRFPAMRLVKDVMRRGDSMAIALNAANEIANQAFRDGRISFTEIVSLVEQVLEYTTDHSVTKLDEVWSVDAQARRMAEDVIRDMTGQVV